jgi:hypothetical protein
VHHVAMAIASEDEQLRLREELIAFGSKVTEVRESLLLQVDLLPRAGRRPLRGGDHRARVHGGRRAIGTRSGAEAAAVGGAASRGHRIGAGADTSPIVGSL